MVDVVTVIHCYGAESSFAVAIGGLPVATVVLYT